MNYKAPPDDMDCTTVGYATYAPLVDISGKYPDYTVVKGPIVEAMAITLARLGKCMRIVGSNNWLVGEQLPNSTWTGMIGKIIRNEGADVYMSVFTSTPERNRDMRQSVPFGMGDTSLVWRNPTLKPDLAGFVKPYKYDVWYTIAIFMLLLSVLMSVMAGSHGAEISPKTFIKRVNSWLDSLLAAVSILLSQGINTSKQTSKAIIGVWLFSCLVITTVYKSNLKAMLITPRLEKPFNSLEELLEKTPPSTRVAALTGSAIVELTRESAQNESLGQLYSRFNFFDRVEGEKFLMNPSHPVVVSSVFARNIVGYKYSQTGTCDIYLTEPFLTAFTLNMYFNKGSPIAKEFDVVISRLKSFGIFDQMSMKERRFTSRCLNQNLKSEINLNRPLALGDFYGLLFLWGGGLFLSCVVFAIEVLYGRKTCQKEGPDQKTE